MARAGLPPSWDPELSELFADQPELLETARRLRASRPQAELGSNFRPYLRARLLDAAASELRPRGLRRFLPRPVLLGWGGVGIGAALIAAVVVTWLVYTPIDRVQVVSFNSAVDGHADVRPDDVIRISFNQAMDQQAVVAGLHIHPATAVTTRWEGDTLVVTPTHHLATNTPYTVTIPQQSARSQSGQTAPTAIAITFGTERVAPSVASPTPAPVPALALHTVAVTGDDHAGLVVGADGAVVVTSATAPPATPAPSPSPSASASASAGLPTPPAITSLTAPAGLAAAAASASPGSSAAPGGDPGLLRVAAGGASTRLGPPVAAVAVSGVNGSIAEVKPDGHGGALIVVVGPDGTTPTTLTTTDTPTTPIAWGGDVLHPTIVYLSGGMFHSVDLQRTVKTLDSRHPVVAGQAVVLSGNGAFAYLGPPPAPASPSPSPGATPTASPAASPSASASASPGAEPPGGEVVDLGSGAAHPLPQSAAVAAFSSDGSRVAWVVEESSGPQLDVAPAAGGDLSSVLVPGAGTGSTVDRLTLDANGTRAAYALHASDGSGELRVVSLPDGAVLATGPVGALQPSLSPAGDVVAVLVPDGTGRDSVQVAAVPQRSGSATPQPSPSTIPGDVDRLLSAVIAAQTTTPLDVAALNGLAGPAAATTLGTSTPPALDRGYIVRVAPDPSRAGAFDAHLRLVRDPAKDAQDNIQPARFADEDLVVGRAGGAAYQVVAVTVTPLQTEPSGPQVVSVQGVDRVFRLTFDSDLRPQTVAGAVTVRDAAGAALGTAATYDADTRTIVVTVASGIPATLQVSTALVDVDGQPLAAAYSTPLDGTTPTPVQPGLASPAPTPGG